MTLLLAAKDGQNAAAVAALQGAGATVEYRSDECRTSASSSDRQRRGGRLDRRRAGRGRRPGVPLPRRAGREPSREPQPPPGPATPNDNPYMPIGETGSAAFISAHPTWDGRGIDDRHRRHRRRPAPPGLRRRARASARSSTGSPARTRQRRRPDVAREHDRVSRQGREVRGGTTDVHGAGERPFIGASSTSATLA